MEAKRPSDATKFFGKILNKFEKIDRKCEQISATGEVVRDPSLMVKGSSSLYKTKEEAEEVMKNPDIPFAKQYVKNMIDRILEGK